MKKKADTGQVSDTAIVEKKDLYSMYEVAEKFKGLNFNKQAELRKSLQIKRQKFRGKSYYSREHLLQMLVSFGWGLMPLPNAKGKAEFYWIDLSSAVKEI